MLEAHYMYSRQVVTVGTYALFGMFRSSMAVSTVSRKLTVKRREFPIKRVFSTRVTTAIVCEMTTILYWSVGATTGKAYLVNVVRIYQFTCSTRVGLLFCSKYLFI